MVAPQITIENTFSRALAQAFDESRLRPDIARTINRIMQQWVSYAMAKIPTAQKMAIKARLEAPAVRSKFQQGVRRVGARGRESASARYQLLKHSVAAYIVWTTNYKRNGKPARQMSGQEFYATVGKYVGSRQFSAGHHRGGLRPALNTFRVAGGQAARLQNDATPVSQHPAIEEDLGNLRGFSRAGRGGDETGPGAGLRSRLPVDQPAPYSPSLSSWKPGLPCPQWLASTPPSHPVSVSPCGSG
jgi:hypothetical protein